jgi:hypothetical protein
MIPGVSALDDGDPLRQNGENNPTLYLRGNYCRS